MIELAYGGVLIRTIPDDARAAYGARLIERELLEGSKGIVHDRQDVFGDDVVSEELFRILNGERGEAAWDGLRKQMLELKYSSRQAQQEGVFEYRDGDFTLRGTSNGSGGYVYVVAFLV